MRNRKPINKRGKLSRQRFVQEVPEAKEIRVDGKIVSNPDFGKMRRVIHHQTPKL